MFAYQQTRGAVDVAFTDRHGGVSQGSFASLNLAQTSDDDAAAIAENMRLAVGAFTSTSDTGSGTPNVVRMHQVHGGDVTTVDRAMLRSGAVPESDGLVTSTGGVVLMVRVADCVPVLLADVDAGVVGAAHAGRPGLVAGVVPATVARMRDLGARDLVAWIGPYVCGRCYEVPHSMRADVSAVVPEAYAETSWGTPAVDVGAGVRAQLAAEGVEVVDASRCTREDDDLYSYRRQGAEAGRMAGLVWVRP
ncbi:MAG: peptidoglycan editing factor PgeF [Nocardioidaceae bacterium]